MATRFSLISMASLPPFSSLLHTSSPRSLPFSHHASARLLTLPFSHTCRPNTSKNHVPFRNSMLGQQSNLTQKSHIYHSSTQLGTSKPVRNQIPAPSATAVTVVPEAAQPEFQLDLAVLMGRFSFDAYLTPDLTGRFTQNDTQKCEVTYLTDGFLRERYTGQLTVKVVKGEAVPDVDWMGKSDTYVLLESGDVAVKTETREGTLSPTWDETLTLLISASPESTLKVSGKDVNFGSSDKNLGEATLKLADYCDGSVHSVDVKLGGEGGGATISLKVQYESFDALKATMPPPIARPAISADVKAETKKLFEALLVKIESTAGKTVTAQEEELINSLFKTQESTRAAWSFLVERVGHPVCDDSQFERICFLSSSSTNTQAIISRDLPNKRLVLAFRGTETSALQDFVTNLRTLPITDGFNSKVHRGFEAANDSVKSRLNSLMESILEAPSDNGKKWEVWITGHSLGGALSTLFVKQWCELPTASKYETKMYNFGAPRVGNLTYVTEYAAAVKTSCRIVNLRDIVPTVPRISGYYHVPSQHIVTIQSPLDNMASGETYWQTVERENKLAQQLYGDGNIFSMLWNSLGSMITVLVDGSGLAMHEGDKYYFALVQDLKRKMYGSCEE